MSWKKVEKCASNNSVRSFYAANALYACTYEKVSLTSGCFFDPEIPQTRTKSAVGNPSRFFPAETKRKEEKVFLTQFLTFYLNFIQRFFFSSNFELRVSFFFPPDVVAKKNLSIILLERLGCSCSLSLLCSVWMERKWRLFHCLPVAFQIRSSCRITLHIANCV